MSDQNLPRFSKASALEFDPIQLVLRDNLHDCLSKGSTIRRSGYRGGEES